LLEEEEIAPMVHLQFTTPVHALLFRSCEAYTPLAFRRGRLNTAYFRNTGVSATTQPHWPSCHACES